ncbi:MAG: SAM-dependent chlorinase/fluorinase [Acidobacteria bacterium]|nr:SAM-dependent chlorinase/fluorinase [Acidobacteriota bacterium]
MQDPLITLTSDFGTREYYVAAVKGVILRVCPAARIVDITHDVASHDVLEGAFTLSCAYSSFPQRTIHLIVVDPDVGSARRALIVCTDDYWFIAPDNGVLSLVYAQEKVNRVISIQVEHYFRRPVSPTFHGRDIFAPVVGWLARGIDVGNFGPEIRDYSRLALPPLKRINERSCEGVVLHIDRFGNLITNASLQEIKECFGRDRSLSRVVIEGQAITRFYRFYAEASGDELFAIFGSSGRYEIAASKKSAARLLNAKRGSRVEMEFS